MCLGLLTQDPVDNCAACRSHEVSKDTVRSAGPGAVGMVIEPRTQLRMQAMPSVKGTEWRCMPAGLL